MTTERVFNAIKKAKPSRLYIVNNAPSPNANEHELNQIKKIRKLVTNIDWDCELKTLFRDNHLLTKESIVSSINWFFENEDEGIIFEDDCLPNHSFFEYCDALLDYQRNEKSIFIISGANVEPDIEFSNSYRFSKYAHIWGWASWKDRWAKYDQNISQWNKNKLRWFFDNNGFSLKEKLYWATLFNKIKMNEINTWDHQLLFITWIHGFKNVIPKFNLISNIGFGIDANFTTDLNHANSNQIRKKMKMPLSHAGINSLDHSLDTKVATRHFKINLVGSFFRYIYSELYFQMKCKSSDK